ncbi:alpha/beta fold hydrolase [Burkholderia ubonensis]|uniref:alpha/beta fold hydrolase n=1 Tax=Burkholderia ubonensis TaxID=101571 RepID=UPI001C4D7C8B|nr:alpha/beta fold hydrolase [Burkholderia ubonensis]
MKTFAIGKGRWGLRYHDLPGWGIPTLFIHGLGCASSSDYPGVAAASALSARRMLLVDLLGSGFSDRPTDFSYSVADHANTIAALADHLSFPELNLFGHSMGGAVAVVAAASSAERSRHWRKPTMCRRGMRS